MYIGLLFIGSVSGGAARFQGVGRLDLFWRELSVLFERSVLLELSVLL
jgi:hypothetical protein